MSIHTDVSQIPEGTSTIPDPTGLSEGRFSNPLARLRNTSIQCKSHVNPLSISCQPSVNLIPILPILCQSIPILCQSIANPMPNKCQPNRILFKFSANPQTIYQSKADPCQLTLNRTNKSVNPLATRTHKNSNASLIRQSNANPRQSMTSHTDISQIADGTSTIRTDFWSQEAMIWMLSARTDPPTNLLSIFAKEILANHCLLPSNSLPISDQFDSNESSNKMPIILQ